MDKKLIIAVAAAVIASGCTDIQGSSQSSSTGSVSVSHFSINDNTLRPEQEASVSLVIENMDPEAEIDSLELVNTGALQLDSQSWQQRCGTSQLPDPVGDQPGLMECSWQITAPSDSQLGAFNSKTYSPQLMLRYNTQFSNSDSPVKVESVKSDDIQNPQRVTRSFSNGEIRTEISYENPIPAGLEVPMNIRVSANDQHVVSEGYEFTLFSVSSVQSCKETEPRNGRINLQLNPDPRGQAQFSCTLLQQSENTRNLIFATSYKYQQSPSITVEVVQN